MGRHIPHMPPLIECVPNFSEGRDPVLIGKITDAIGAVVGVRLLNVDPGHATNRTVVTFVGQPEAVIEAAFRGIRTAAELIDMRTHRGEHPRMGATDVCPLIPVSGITMDDTVEYARRLAQRVGRELHIPVYLYEAAQPDKARSNLAAIRAGEYEGLARRIVTPEWKPDFGPAEFNPRSGATVIGARDFLVAYNVNLNTTSTRRANAIAFDVREAGRTVKDAAGRDIVQPGTLKAVKAIGWYIAEYGIAQVSMNLTNLNVTPLHVAFDEVCRAAAKRGIRVTGSELVGLVPLSCLLDAGRYFLEKQQRSTGISERELVRIAVRSLGLDDLAPFKPEERVIEYLLKDPVGSQLATMSLADFMAETASESPAPGGGSIAAYVGALGAALGTMVANLSSHKRGWDDRWKEFSESCGAGSTSRAGIAPPGGRRHASVHQSDGGDGASQGNGPGQDRAKSRYPGGDPGGDRSPLQGDGVCFRIHGGHQGHGGDRPGEFGVGCRCRSAVRTRRRHGRLPQRPDQCQAIDRPGVRR